jgi:4,5-dihydroxyphthalate decarboxylase
LEEQQSLLGPDPWVYGFEPNRHVLETAADYAYEQGLTTRRLEVRDLFAASTLDPHPTSWTDRSVP